MVSQPCLRFFVRREPPNFSLQKRRGHCRWKKNLYKPSSLQRAANNSCMRTNKLKEKEEIQQRQKKQQEGKPQTMQREKNLR